MEFGELLEPVSRAFWDDINDLEENNEVIKLELKWISRQNFPEKIERLLIIDGPKLPHLVKTTLLKNCPLHCKIIGANISVYSIPDKNCLICLSEEIKISLSGLITELMTDWLQKCDEVITVQIQTEASYKSNNMEDLNNTTFFYGINSKLKHIKELSSPNFITGVSAAVASWRYFNKLPVSSYVLYTCLTEFDENSIAVILHFFEDVGLKLQEKYDYQQQNLSSYLYM